MTDGGTEAAQYGPHITNPFDFKNVAWRDEHTYEVTIPISNTMLHRLIDDWSEPLQIQMQRCGEELVPVFRTVAK